MQFDKEINRQDTHSMKYDNRKNVFGTEDVIPLWVADMDFQAPQEVNDMIKSRAEHGVYGYTIMTEDIKESVVNWLSNRHDWKVNESQLTFSPGVITSLHIAIQQFTSEGDKILIQTPVYTPFFNLINNGNRQLVESELIEQNGKYVMDFADLESKFKDGVKAMIFCSPHNPVGRVWTKEELEKLAQLCVKYDVLLLSDEIHADIVFKDYKHIPIATISDEIAEQTITFMSATKTFNLAGLQSSYIVTMNRKFRLKLQSELNLLGFSMLNTFGTLAIKEAYNHGEKWLNEFLNTIENNKNYVKDRLENETYNRLKVIDSEGTYLVWVDCSKLGLSDEALKKFMIKKAKVGLNAGISYGEAGSQFMRINIACPQSTLEKAVNQIIAAIK